jgi:hypothetical protein
MGEVRRVFWGKRVWCFGYRGGVVVKKGKVRLDKAWGIRVLCGGMDITQVVGVC